MASTYTTSNRLPKPAKGDMKHTWATEWLAPNANMLDEALDGHVAVAVSGSVTLTTANGATDEARNRVLVLTGTGGTVTLPAVEKFYRVINACTGAVVFTQGSGTTATLAPGHHGAVHAYNTGSPVCAVVPAYKTEGVALAAGNVTAAASVACTIPAGIKRVRGYLSGIRQSSGGAVNLNYKLTQSGSPTTYLAQSMSSAVTYTAVFDAAWDETSLKFEYVLATGSGLTSTGWSGYVAQPTAMTLELASSTFDATGTYMFRGWV